MDKPNQWPDSEIEKPHFLRQTEEEAEAGIIHVSRGGRKGGVTISARDAVQAADLRDKGRPIPPTGSAYWMHPLGEDGSAYEGEMALGGPDGVVMIDAALAYVARRLLAQALEALHWCSGSPDFAPGGQARAGWIAHGGPSNTIVAIAAFLLEDDGSRNEGS